MHMQAGNDFYLFFWVTTQPSWPLEAEVDNAEITSVGPTSSFLDDGELAKWGNS